MEDFYNAMTTYVDSKKPKKICEHKRTFYWHGRRACVECGLCIHKVFSQDPYSNVCLDLELKKKVRCHRRSLCAAILWKKVKSLYPEVMTLTEFSKRVGVSVPTIIKTCKKLK